MKIFINVQKCFFFLTSSSTYSAAKRNTAHQLGPSLKRFRCSIRNDSPCWSLQLRMIRFCDSLRRFLVLSYPLRWLNSGSGQLILVLAGAAYNGLFRATAFIGQRP